MNENAEKQGFRPYKPWEPQKRSEPNDQTTQIQFHNYPQSD